MSELTIEQANELAPLVSPQQAAARIAAGAVFIDVRSAAGRAGAGAIPGATVVAKDDVAELFAPDSETRWAAVTSDSTPVVVICGSVLGSGPVAAQLLSYGLTDVVHVEGGFPAWQHAGLPTEPPTNG